MSKRLIAGKSSSSNAFEGAGSDSNAEFESISLPSLYRDMRTGQKTGCNSGKSPAGPY